jgi:hypothetical protein
MLTSGPGNSAHDGPLSLLAAAQGGAALVSHIARRVTRKGGGSERGEEAGGRVLGVGAVEALAVPVSTRARRWCCLAGVAC